MFSFLRSLTSGTRAAALPIAAVLTAAVATAQSQTFVFTGTLQTFTVPTGITTLFVQADGGKGGNANGAGAGAGGLGARVTGLVPCTPGATLQILVGRGGSTTTNGNGGGGGGGTFLAFGTAGFADFATPMLVAGGGGGGSAGPTGTSGQAGGTLLGGNGHGGASAQGAGGGGILTNGAQSFWGGGAGQRIIAGGAGGSSHGFSSGGAGGFGGGGGSGGVEGAGGGGYSGGRGGLIGTGVNGGRGGTSYADATVGAFVNTPGGNPIGGGSVTLSWGSISTFSSTGNLATFVVPPGAVALTITAAGGSGGDAQGASAIGGAGGRIRGTCSLPAGTTLQILVGGRGTNTANNNGGGGGGGSFVTVGAGFPDFATPLLVAGGGGGGSRPISAGVGPGGAGGLLLGGSGNGGNAGNGASGAGILGGGNNSSFGGGGGQAIVAGGAGGAAHSFAVGGAGGFGGGGGCGGREGSGGGGYTGGAGAASTGNAFGGRSYAAPSMTFVDNSPGANAAADGSVTIEVHFSLAAAPSVGAGCPSSGGSNTLVADSLPWLNSTFQCSATGLPNLALVAVVTGFSPTALPLSIVFAQGQPGCNLLVNPDLVDVLFATGTATAQVVLPNTLTLAGATFYQQMVPLEVDPLLNVIAVTATNALQMTVGY